MGDDFGFTVIECIKCSERTSILESTLIAGKLLNPLGEDYCKVYGRLDYSILGGEIVFVDYLLFTEFQTKVELSVDDRMKKIRLGKDYAVKNQWFEKAARLRKEERIIEFILRQLDKYLKP